MSLKNVCSIYFFVEGQRYATRAWHAVPRVGDEVMLNDRTKNGDKSVFRVIRVVFGVENKDDATLGYQCVNVELERPE